MRIARRRWTARGGDAADLDAIALWVIVGGVIGARTYHVITDPELFRGHWLRVFAIWEGGLGIWGAVAGGAIATVITARKRNLDAVTLMDAMAPAVAVAQAIGRWGNWVNQEVFGRPTTLPWGLEISLNHRPAGYERFATFQPTFLYESLWCLAVAGLLVWAERRYGIVRGRTLALYIALYTFGRFWFELLRIDHANRILGLRVNSWVSVIVFSGAVLWIIGSRSRRETSEREQDAVVADSDDADTGQRTPR